LSTYASVPIIATDHRLFGTLCGASRSRRPVADTTITAMESFARLIVDQMARDDVHRAERRAGLAERQLTDRAKFLAEAEHQLKTPLIVLTGFADALKRRGATMSEEDRSAAVTVIHKNAWRLSDQIDRLLEESLAEVRGRDLHPTVIDLRETVVSAIRGFQESAEDHGLRLVAGDEVRALADPEALHQLLAHLLDNAIKYSGPGTNIVISVRHAGASAEIDVRDDGIGIPTNIDLFAPFQRGHDATLAARPGVGLGLHIVRNLATAMGGTVTAARNPDHGSTFTLQLPDGDAAPTASPA
jgi:signal transduction histidine kinase